MTKKKGEFTVLRNIRAGMVIILLIYIGLIFQSKGDSDTPFEHDTCRNPGDQEILWDQSKGL